MRKRLFSALILLMTAVGATAAEPVATPPQFLLPKVVKPIVIDGSLNDWDREKAQVTLTPEGTERMRHYVDPANPIKGAGDISGRVSFAWDATHLYIAGDVTDDQLLGVKPDSLGNQGPAPWGSDSVMVVVNSYSQAMRRNNPYSNEVTLGLRYAPTGPQPRGALLPNARSLDSRDKHWMITPNGKWAVAETPTGYAVEAAIPWADLDYEPRTGARLFIAIMLVDMDPDQPLKQLGWGWDDRPTFRLVERDDAVGLLTLSLDDIPTTSAWTARLDVDALSRQAAVDRLRVVDATGKIVLENPVTLEIPPGMTGTAFATFAPGQLPVPGSYTLEALLKAPGDNAVLVRAPLRMVEPAPEPPMIQNPGGEINRMRPSRVAHNAADLHQRGLLRHSFVRGRDDYLPFILKHVEPGFIAKVRQQIDTNGPWGTGYLMQCLALHKATGNDEYMTLGRDLMDFELTRVLTASPEATYGEPSRDTIDAFKLVPIAAYRYHTWLKTPDSPWAPPDAEKRYRAMFYPVAAKPHLYYFSESGTHNRIWHRYSMLKVARQIAEEDGQPVDPRVIAYTDYHADLLEATGDDDDASSGYNWGWFHYPQAIYHHQGDLSPLLTNPGYLRAISRYRDLIAPSGAMPTYGSDSGWPSVGASISLFEEMAALTGDGSFRWVAHRVAEYLYNHLEHDVTQYHLPADGMKSLFLMAYFHADEDVAPVPPAASGANVVWRPATRPTTAEEQKAQPGLNTVVLDTTRLIPEKLVLGSGHNPRNPWAMVELLASAGHGGALPGNLITLIGNDSVLLAGQGYYEQTPQFQNIMWIEDLEGLAAAPQLAATTVPLLADDAAFSFARVETSTYQQMPLTYTRDLLFSKAGFVVVKDRVTFTASMKVRLGPAFQTRNVGPKCGPNWFNTYYEEMYLTGLGLGRGVQSFHNPPWDLLIYFVPREGRKHTVADTYDENPYRQSPIRMRQEWQGMAEPNSQITFTTILLPHEPTFNPDHLLQPPPESKAAPRIEIIRDDDEVTVLQVTSISHDGRTLSAHWVLLNTSGQSVQAGLLESDAQIAFIRVGGDTVQDCAMIGGTVLRVDGVDVTARARNVTATAPVIPATFTN